MPAVADMGPLKAEKIVAVVTTDKEKVTGGGVPIFLAPDRQEAENTALLIARIMGAMVHDLGNGCLLIVVH